MQRKLADELKAAKQFDENVAQELPHLLLQLPNTPAVQQELADILLDLSHFLVFYNSEVLKFELLKYPPF